MELPKISFLFCLLNKELNTEKERDFLKTLALIKNKDPKIYDKDTKFYSDGKCYFIVHNVILVNLYCSFYLLSF